MGGAVLVVLRLRQLRVWPGSQLPDKAGGYRAPGPGLRPVDQQQLLVIRLDLAKQERSEFRYGYPACQVGYSRNLLFASGAQFRGPVRPDPGPDPLASGHLAAADPVRPHCRPHRTRKDGPAAQEIETEKPLYGLSWFRRQAAYQQTRQNPPLSRCVGRRPHHRRPAHAARPRHRPHPRWDSQAPAWAASPQSGPPSTATARPCALACRRCSGTSASRRSQQPHRQHFVDRRNASS
jgi:hypothetical protein